MKRLRKFLTGKLPFLIALFIVSAGVVYAAVYSNPTHITGITLGTSTPDLKISTTDSGPWSDSITAGSLSMDLSSIYPGWVSNEYTIYLKNNSAGMPFDAVMVSVNSVSSVEWNELKEDVMMRFQEQGGSTWTSHSLDVWNRTPYSITGSPLATGTSRSFKVKFDLSSTATASGKTLNFGIDFTGKK